MTHQIHLPFSQSFTIFKTILCTKYSSFKIPLRTNHRNGLIAVAVFGFLSVITTTILFIYLTYKLARWSIRQAGRKRDNHQANMTDLSLGLSEAQYSQSRTSNTAAVPAKSQLRDEGSVSKGILNQFLFLVYSLVFAELQQSIAFRVNASWVGSNGIFVRTSTCWAQWWFVSVGDLAASCFISAIAVYTNLTVIRGYKPPQWVLYLAIACLWTCLRNGSNGNSDY
ncbi:hypothetical protein BKA67DRAFT_362558 [Truncatella angustata]|uniref:Uncharacterized protein n=1 Tax=Truncatella angustata TaxID=152316 RepID=A0A9P8UED9_9PEZI|nr:uncharacterized protein BKA67DRAFT_362558 [Truncatella angustata]KAH6648389.1 hypothetical protein BKA67DRAFT_362558 [Truncatella angustata]